MNFYSLQVPVFFKHNKKLTKIFLLKTITVSVLLFAGIFAGTAATAQQITLNEKNAPLKKIFNLIKKQGDYIFFYEKGVLDKTAPVTINVSNAGIRDVLEICLKNQPLSYIISGNNIGIKRKTAGAEGASGETAAPAALPDEDILIWGVVVDSVSNPKQGVTVTSISGGSHQKTFAVTNADGTFEVYGQKGDKLVFSAIGHRNVEVKYNGEVSLKVTMKVAPIEMNAVVIDDIDMSRKRIPFTDTIDMTHRTHLNLGQLLQGSIPGLTLQNSSQSQQTLQSIDFTGRGVPVTGTYTPTIAALRAHYNQYQSIYASTGYPTFDSWINSMKGVDGVRFNYSTSVGNNGLIPQLRGVSGFSGNTSGMLIIIDGFAQDGFPANYPMTNIESVKVIKDPEELTKWGPRATGGIIMITSKRAVKGKLQLSYSSNLNYAAAPRFNRSKLRLASSADIVDYLKSASDSGFMVLGSKNDPRTAFSLNSAERIFYGWQIGALSEHDYNTQLDSLGRLSNESQLRQLQQNSFNQNQMLTLSGGSNAWRFRAAGIYNTTRSTALGNYSRMFSLNMNNDFLLFKNKLRAQWYINVSQNTARTGANSDFRSLQPYQLLVDPVSGKYVYDYSTFNPDANTALKKYGYEDYGANVLEDARINSQISKNLQVQSRLNTDWDILPSLRWSTSLQYDLLNGRTENLLDAVSSPARQLVNEYGSPAFDDYGAVTGIDFYVPRGGIMKKSSLKNKDWNLRSALLFNKNFGKHYFSASIGGGGFGNASRSPSYATIYGYNKQTRQGQAVLLPSPDPTAGVLNLFSLPDRYWEGTYGRMVYPNTLLTPAAGDTIISRGLNWNGSFSYSYNDTYILNGKYNTTLSPNYGNPRPYTNLTNYSADATWRLSRQPFFQVPSWITNVALTAGVDGISLPGLPTQITAQRDLQSNWNNYGVWVVNFTPAQQSGQSSYNVYEKLGIGLLEDRYTFDISYNSLRINNNNSGDKTTSGYEIKNYVGANARVRLRQGLLHLYAGYGYSLDGNPQTNMRVAYDIARESYFHAGAISKLLVDFTLQNISAYQGMEIMAGTNAPLSGGGFTMAVNNSFGQLPPTVKNMEVHSTLGLANDRYLFDIRYYQTNTAGLNNFIPVPTDPSTGLGTKISYSEIVKKGVEMYLQIKVLQQKDFKYVITLNGAYNKNIAKDVPLVNFSQTSRYLTDYRNGYSTENLWSYRWAGLDATGSPRIYDAKGQSTASPDSATLASSLVYSGVTRPPFTGGLIQEWDYKGFFLRATLLLNFGHVMREYLPSPSRTQDNSLLIRDRWRKPGDEAFTDIAAMSGNGDEGSTRKFIIQNSTNSIMSADNIRLQEVQIGWQALSGKMLQRYFIKDLTVSLQMLNAALWTSNRLHVDPETVANTGEIELPNTRQYMFTVNMKF
ncbi:TonB-dependent receptor plug domain-containing protein [Chitinophaga sp. CC14]|uniref:SusC/RagA family TonB-linked outer membrane protein n=1 Tax=Chitinophaga sp. CC14 TaxID=3029199 RepID=UPI003B785459